MKARHHILFISSWYPKLSGSAGTFVEMHLLALQSMGCKCAIMLNGEITLGNFVSKGFKKNLILDYRRHADIQAIDNLTVHKAPLRFAKDPILQRKQNILSNSEKVLRKYIDREGRPDVIFHHGIFDYCYLSSFLSEKFQLPIWYMENSPNLTKAHLPCANPYDNQSDQKDFVHRADRRFAVTEAYVARMTQLFGIAYELCPNVVTNDFFIDINQVQRSKKYFQFINVAILDERKNQKLILKAFAKNFRSQPDFRLVIAGDGPLLQALRDEADALEISGQVKILGYQSRAQIKALLDTSHCFVLSSHSETFGVVIVEAMARGLPAISSRIDGPEEIISAQTGVLFEADDEEKLAEAMLEISNNYGRYDHSTIVNYARSNYGPGAVKKALFPND